MKVLSWVKYEKYQNSHSGGAEAWTNPPDGPGSSIALAASKQGRFLNGTVTATFEYDGGGVSSRSRRCCWRLDLGSGTGLISILSLVMSMDGFTIPDSWSSDSFVVRELIVRSVDDRLCPVLKLDPTFLRLFSAKINPSMSERRMMDARARRETCHLLLITTSVRDETRTFILNRSSFSSLVLFVTFESTVLESTTFNELLKFSSLVLFVTFESTVLESTTFNELLKLPSL